VGCQHLDAVVEIGEQQCVDDETSAITRDHGDLADAVDEGPSLLDDLVVTANGRHHLDQLHDRWGVEEVQADDSLGTIGGHGAVDDRQGRRGGRQNGVWPHDIGQPAEHVPLDIQVLGNRLDDKVAVGQVAKFCAWVDASQCRVDIGGRQSLLVDQPLHE